MQAVPSHEAAAVREAMAAEMRLAKEQPQFASPEAKSCGSPEEEPFGSAKKCRRIEAMPSDA